MRPKLGYAYKDIVIDKTGYVTAVTDYMNGCVRVTLEGLDFIVDGKPLDHFCDAQQLRIDESKDPLAIGPPVDEPSAAPVAATGGPGAHEARRTPPKRW